MKYDVSEDCLTSQSGHFCVRFSQEEVVCGREINEATLLAGRWTVDYQFLTNSPESRTGAEFVTSPQQVISCDY